MGPHQGAGAGQAMEVRLNLFSLSLIHVDDSAGRICPFPYSLRRQHNESEIASPFNHTSIRRDS